MKQKRTCYFLFFLFFTLILCFINLYLNEILLFEAKLRNFIINGRFDLKIENEKGIPISLSPRIGKFVSPFYVVNYGILYSETLRSEGIIKPYVMDKCWAEDSSLKYWYFPVDRNKVTLDFFKNQADWIVDNIQIVNNKAHLIYNFDWSYPKYKYKLLKAPWWSGLTDGYAIVLLIRAYDVFKEEKYLITAKKLYESVISPISKDGSLTKLNNYLWIEEYVDPKHPYETPKVLNGMIYSFYGIKCYEERMNINLHSRYSVKLAESIEKNIQVFDKGLWSYYDAIGNSANLKYHRIHVALLNDLIRDNGLELNTVYNKWKIGANYPILWIVYSDFSISKLHFFADLALVLIFIIIILRFICKRFQ